MSLSPLSVLGQLSSARIVGAVGNGFTRVHSDTRSLQAGDFFVALRGERFDAHDFLPELRSHGVQLAMAQHGLAAAGLSGVEVADTRRALGEWARLWRAQLSLPVIAVTGSNGKTTVTQMLAAIGRAALGDAALATQGNLNNDIGVPLTLLRLNPSHRLAAIELGMNHPGEIAHLAAMAQPTVALVNNAQREHQEFMGSIDAVASENAAVFAALPADGVAVFALHSPYADLWRRLASIGAAQRRSWTFALDDDRAEVWATAQWRDAAWALQIHSPAGALECRLHMAGAHNVLNALAAAACALAAGLSTQAVAQGLQDFVPVAGRSRLLRVARHNGDLTLIDDSYNANPDSVLAAIELLCGLPGPRTLVLGDMGEVGANSLAFHREVLQAALTADIARIDLTGAAMGAAAATFPANQRLQHWPSMDDLLGQAAARCADSQTVLVKGSRFMRMERVVQALQAAAQRGHGDAA